MANANQDLLGVGQVVKKEGEEDVIRISAKKLRNYLIIAGSILVLVSAVICFAFLSKDKNAAGVVNENADTVSTTGVVSGSVGNASEKRQSDLIVEPGPFSTAQVIEMARVSAGIAMERRTYEEYPLKRMRFHTKECVVRVVEKEGNAYVIEASLKGDYDAAMTKATLLFNMNLLIFAKKTNYGNGYEILKTDTVNIALK